MDAALQEMIEARAIEQLMIRYIDRVDANDPVGAAACFAEDGLGVYWGDYRGREAIAERLGEHPRRVHRDQSPPVERRAGHHRRLGDVAGVRLRVPSSGPAVATTSTTGGGGSTSCARSTGSGCSPVEKSSVWARWCPATPSATVATPATRAGCPSSRSADVRWGDTVAYWARWQGSACMVRFGDRDLTWAELDAACVVAGRVARRPRCRPR